MYGEYDSETLDRLHKAQLIVLNDFAALCDRNDIPFFAIAGTAIGAVRHKGFIPWDDDIDVVILAPDFERFVECVEAELSDKYEIIGAEFANRGYNLQFTFSRKNTLLLNDYGWAANANIGISLDLFVYDEIPKNEREARAFFGKCKVLNVLYLAHRVRFHRLVSKDLNFITNLKYAISGMLGFILRLIPKSDEMLARRYRRLCRKYSGKTNRFSSLNDLGVGKMYVDGDEIFPLVSLSFEDTEIKLVREYEAQIKRHMGSDYMELPPSSKRTNHPPRVLDFGVLEDEV